jgi:quinoprotein glucose dehydrogenase
MPGEAASPTQPYPTAPPPFARQKFTPDDIDPFILTAEQRAMWKDRISSARNEGLYTPPGFRETVQMPGNNGGGNFWGTATDLLTGTVYVVSKETPAMLKMLANPQTNTTVNANLSTAQRGRLVFDANCQLCHGADAKGQGIAPSLIGVLERRGADDTRQFITRGEGEMPAFPLSEQTMADLINFLSDPSDVPQTPAAARGASGGSGGRGGRAEVPYPKGVDVPPVRYYTGYGLEPRVIGPPWSQLTAYDLNRGTIKWQIPYGDAAEAGPSDSPRGTIFQRSGIAVTAGGLIFFAGNDPVMHILDKDTGKELRSIKLPNGVQGVPVVYEVDGREYVAFCSTGGEDVGSSQRSLPHVYVAFALPAGTLNQKK